MYAYLFMSLFLRINFVFAILRLVIPDTAIITYVLIQCTMHICPSNRWGRQIVLKRSNSLHRMESIVFLSCLINEEEGGQD